MALRSARTMPARNRSWTQLGPDRPAYLIRRTMTEAKVTATDRRAVFIGAEAYGEAGGTILRDLFTEDGGGWFEDPALLDRLVGREAGRDRPGGVRDEEGWKWAEAQIDYPHAAGLARVYPHRVERAEEETAEMTALGEEYDALVSQNGMPRNGFRLRSRPGWPRSRRPWKPSAMARPIDAEEIARGGVFVILGQEGVARFERGFDPARGRCPLRSPSPSAGDDEAPAALPAARRAVAETVEAEEEDAGAPLCRSGW